ncbi:hypothetical protein GUJ93_ZPchr0012g19558 [Zizania palustris]|uniref:Uncharacterized protein n=1 Tax=Zizania palustris TaxID=103762 RepID=A0A8J5WRP3_ZIZPA|nr:hypothetical protein GUJ93_ZPchr0012g19558 [Zizania palustris]
MVVTWSPSRASVYTASRSGGRHRCCALDISHPLHKARHDLHDRRALDAHASRSGSCRPDLHGTTPYLHWPATHRQCRYTLDPPTRTSPTTTSAPSTTTPYGLSSAALTSMAATPYVHRLAILSGDGSVMFWRRKE